MKEATTPKDQTPNSIDFLTLLRRHPRAGAALAALISGVAAGCVGSSSSNHNTAAPQFTTDAEQKAMASAVNTLDDHLIHQYLQTNGSIPASGMGKFTVELPDTKASYIVDEERDALIYTDQRVDPKGIYELSISYNPGNGQPATTVDYVAKTIMDLQATSGATSYYGEGWSFGNSTTLVSDASVTSDEKAVSVLQDTNSLATNLGIDMNKKVAFVLPSNESISAN